MTKNRSYVNISLPTLPKHVKLFIFCFSCIVCTGCDPLAGYTNLVDYDVSPPILLNVEVISENSCELYFSEAVTAKLQAFKISNQFHLEQVTVNREVLTLSTTEAVAPGEPVVIEGRVSDDNGNSLWFSTVWYGLNTRIPEMIINEFTTQGSKTHPDRIELLTLSAGNTAGMCLYIGDAVSQIQKKVLPSIEVFPGDYLIIHCTEEAGDMRDECNSTADNLSSTAHKEAWDLWIPKAKGLSGNNGAITLYSSPRGHLIDAVLYSNRNSGSDATYRGFGSTQLMETADRLFEEGAWKLLPDVPETGLDGIAQEFSDTGYLQGLRPEECINPDDSTATRSMCRDVPYTDSHTALDWHIVPTGGASFGEENSNERYSVP